MRVLIVSPTYFDPTSVMGGGERYPTELALKLSQHVETTLVSFSSQRISKKIGRLKLEVFPVITLLGGTRNNPLNLHFLRLIGSHDIVHTHQIFTMVSDLACLGATLLGKKAFVTDHGGGAARVLNRRLPVLPLYHEAISQSAYGARRQPVELRNKTRTIKGGVDQDVFVPSPTVPRQQHLLFVGRFLSHKGVDYLIRAFRLWGRKEWRLRLVGRPYEPLYHEELQKLAQGINVDFITDADDQALLREYRSARMTILPSVHTDHKGGYSAVSELMGLTLLESQSCSTPAICSDAGGMPEFVADGVTGRVVRQNSPESLAEAFDYLADPVRWAACSEAARPFCEQFSMRKVAELHLETYGGG